MVIRLVLSWLFIFALCACGGSTQMEVHKPTEQEVIKPAKQIKPLPDLNPQIAVEFINSYIDNINRMSDAVEIREWTRKSELVTDNFKSSIDNLINEAFVREPEIGLGFDPIINAQDHPDGRFQLLELDKSTGLTTVNGIEGANFHITLKLVNIDGQTLVDGSGIVNMYQVETIELLGVYQFTYQYNTENLIENHYLEFVGEKAFYYGTSDDFDDAREGYYPGFFFTEIENLVLNDNEISFDLKLNDIAFYQKPITPLSQPGNNEPWDMSATLDTRIYKGKINGDTIVITTEGFDTRTFIKKEKP